MTLVQFSVSLGQGKEEKDLQKLKKTMNNSLKTFLSLSILVGVVSAASLRPKHYVPLPRYNFHTHKYTKILTMIWHLFSYLLDIRISKVFVVLFF